MIFVRSWIFFFKQMTAYEMRISDWSSDVCSSDLLAGTILSVEGTDELATLLAANDVLGGSFLSRLNYDLRETKGWAYGVQSIVNRVEHRVPYIVYAPVQADKTGPSIAALQELMKTFLTSKGVTADELSRTINGNIRELPGSYETSGDVLGDRKR